MGRVCCWVDAASECIYYMSMSFDKIFENWNMSMTGYIIEKYTVKQLYHNINIIFMMF